MAKALSRFSEELEGRLRPVVDLLDQTIEGLASPPDEPDPADLTVPLRTLRDGLVALCAKVRAERSYVLLFGPLKSGKSTLMNALSAAYVSEVTSLPAYPCMVHVADADHLEVAATRWDGTVERFPDLAGMRGAIAAAHGALVRALRAAEVEEREFDPTRDLPSAIRRIDVRLPAPELRDSGTVLVDAPGLYTRMKFGTDQLTRDFRLAAASAVFVVKTDNLFLEQVFDEFDDLLRLFSRIFLVVNLDTGKRDLEPDGGLEPSLERRDPSRILAAFEELAMGSALRRARDEGRLSIYPIDLLQAASRRLRRGRAGQTASDSHLLSEDEGAAEGDEDSTGDFARFHDDLIAYLDSHEAAVAFARDSLRQAGELLAELERTCRGDAGPRIGRLMDDAEQARRRALARRDAAHRLTERGFAEAFEWLRDDVAGITRERSHAVRKQTADRAEAVLDQWFESDRSFAQLQAEDLVEVLRACRDGLAELGREAARGALASDVAAAGVRQHAGDDLSVLELPVAALLRKALVDLPAAQSGKSALIGIPTALLPVKRGLLDWLFLRGPVRLRRALFGPEESPTRPIPRAVKQTRLGPAARAVLSSAVSIRLERFFPEALAQCAIAAFGGAATTAGKTLRAAVEQAATDAAAATEETQRRIARLAAQRLAIDLLGRRAEQAILALRQLTADSVAASQVEAVAGAVAEELAEGDELERDRSA